MDDESVKRVIIYKNGVRSNGIDLKPVPETKEEFLVKATELLALDEPAARLFLQNGTEVFEMQNVSDGDFLFVSTGEDFIPINVSGHASSSSGAVGDEEDEAGDFDEQEFDGKALGFEELPPDRQKQILDSLEEGEKVLWTATPVPQAAFVVWLIISLLILGFAGLMSGLIDHWRVTVFLFCVSGFAVAMMGIFTSTIYHEYYALTSRRILILHSGCCFGLLCCKRDVKRSPLFSQLTSFQIEVEEYFGIGSVFFRSTGLGYKHVRNASQVADMIRRRMPQQAPRTLVKF